MGESVLRVSPLTVMEDIGPALSRCRGLGFAVVETEDPGCVGLRAGDSYLILATVAPMARQFRPGTVERLAGRTTPYLHVRSLDRMLARLPESAVVVERVVTPFGTVEALVEDGGDRMLLAERLEDAG